MKEYIILLKEDLGEVVNCVKLDECPTAGDYVRAASHHIYRVLYAIHVAKKDTETQGPTTYLVCEAKSEIDLPGFCHDHSKILFVPPTMF